MYTRSAVTCGLSVAMGLVMALAFVPERAAAAPITYTISGTGSGSLDGTSFTDDLVTITGIGDTANVVTIPLHSLNPVPLTINISGVGTDTITSNAELDIVPAIENARFDANNNSSTLAILIATISSSSAFASYDGTTAIGPVTDTGFTSGNTFPTTGGIFVLSSIGNTTFTATIGSATPLPAALPLFATGLGAIGLLGWRRKRKAQAVA
jgi:hypothetical protein